jgi:hypothetical protein
MMALCFLLKNKSKGGISLGEIGVRSLTRMISELGFPKLDCRGVNDVIGVPISVYCCFSDVLEVGVAGVKGDASCPFFR